MMHQLTLPFMYAGVFFRDVSGQWRGEMLDPQGVSELSDIVIENNSVRFNKRYVRHAYLPHAFISYVFNKREGNTWVGTWRHPSNPTDPQMTGSSRCVITDVDDGVIGRDINAFLEARATEFRDERQELEDIERSL